MPAKKKKAPATKKNKPAAASGKSKAKPAPKKTAAVEFKIVQTVESGPDADGKGMVGDRMAAEAGLLAERGWNLISVHRSESSHFDLPFLVGCFRREGGAPAASGGKRAPAKTKISYKCKEYRPDPDPSKAHKFLNSIYADASKMADKGCILASFFLTADGAMTGMYRSEKK